MWQCGSSVADPDPKDMYEVGSITNANGQIKQKLEEIGGTLFFKIS